MPATDTASTTRTIRLAVVGAGGIARTHVSAARTLGDAVRVTGVADLRADAAEELASTAGAAAFRTPEALLDAVRTGTLEADGLLLCTPPSARTQVIRPALELGLHVLVEKPLATTGEEAQSLARLAAAHPGLVTAVGYCHRFTPAIIEMKRLVTLGRIGRLTRFENVFAFHHPPMSERWFSDPAVSGGGSFIDTGCHSLDIFHTLVGPPTTLGAVRHFGWGTSRGESSATVLVQASDGPNAGIGGVILAGWLEPARFQVRLVGTDGSLFYDYEHAEVLKLTEPNGTVTDLVVETHEVRFARQLGAFASAIAAAGAGGSGVTSSPDLAVLASFADGAVAAGAVDGVAAAG